MEISKRSWQALCLATVIFCFGIMWWYSNAIAKEYAALNDSYMIEITENSALQAKVDQLETEVAELKAQLPK